MDIIRKAFPIIALIMFQLLVFALLNLSINVPNGFFSTGTLVNMLLPVNIILFLLAFASIVVISRTFKSLEEELENKLRIESQEQLEELLLTMRGQRHDFNHHLQIVYGFLSVNAYEEAKLYLEECVAQISLSNEIVRSDNPGLNALLYVKSGEMERCGISFSINIRSSIKTPLKITELNVLLGNLLDNAIQKFSYNQVSEAKIIFEVYKQGGMLILAVSDNGPPIDPLHLDKLFLPGYSTKLNGQGLGLYNSKRIIEKYGGEIQAESGNGLTTFSVYLPL